MKKRILIFTIVASFILVISMCLSYAAQPCEHQYKDDGNCTSPCYCMLCNKVLYVQPEHAYENTISYDLENGNFLLGGQKTKKCSNTGCEAATTYEVLPFITPLGYSVKESISDKETTATLISSYIFNGSEIDTFAEVYSKKVEYGIVCYIPSRMGNDQPILPDGTADITAIKMNLTSTNGVNDLAVPKIPQKSYDERIVIAAYIILDSNVYYIQSNELVSDYKQLTAVSCTDVLNKLSENN